MNIDLDELRRTNETNAATYPGGTSWVIVQLLDMLAARTIAPPDPDEPPIMDNLRSKVDVGPWRITWDDTEVVGIEVWQTERPDGTYPYQPLVILPLRAERDALRDRLAEIEGIPG